MRNQQDCEYNVAANQNYDKKKYFEHSRVKPSMEIGKMLFYFSHDSNFFAFFKFFFVITHDSAYIKITI